MNPYYYLVGGCVRDKLLGNKPHDIDIAVEAFSYEHMRKDLINRGVNIFLETPEYFTIRGTHKDLGAVDYVLCRKDGTYSDGRHPDFVDIGTIYDDLARRDFTINAIAIDENTGEYIDPYDGRGDLDEGLIRAVGSADKRFEEDSLRILRAVRFAIKYNFRIEPDTWDAMKAYVENITLLPEDRIREELYKSLSYDTVRTIDMLYELKAFRLIFSKKKSSLWLMPTNKKA